MATTTKTSPLGTGVLALLPKAKWPKPNALKPRGTVVARLATPTECRAKKANLYMASSVEDLSSMGFEHVLLAPVDDNVAGEHDINLQKEDGNGTSHVLWQHPPWSKGAKVERGKVREAAIMITTVRSPPIELDHSTPVTLDVVYSLVVRDCVSYAVQCRAAQRLEVFGPNAWRRTTSRSARVEGPIPAEAVDAKEAQAGVCMPHSL